MRVKDLTIEDLEYLIEQKVLEILGDPDFGLAARYIAAFEFTVSASCTKSALKCLPNVCLP